MYDDDGWITSKEACHFLSLSYSRIWQLYNEGKIRRLEPYVFKPGKTALYSWADVLKIRFGSARVIKRLRLQYIINEGMPTEWISVAEAADILGISTSSVYKKIRSRTLGHSAMYKGRKCKDMRVSRRQLEKHGSDPERLKNQNTCAQYRNRHHLPKPPATPEEEAEFERKRWITTREAAKMLRISCNALRAIRNRGLLRNCAPPGWWQNTHAWCFDYNDVAALRIDPVHLALRARYLKAFSNEAMDQRYSKVLDKLNGLNASLALPLAWQFPPCEAC